MGEPLETPPKTRVVTGRPPCCRGRYGSRPRVCLEVLSYWTPLITSRSGAHRRLNSLQACSDGAGRLNTQLRRRQQDDNVLLFMYILQNPYPNLNLTPSLSPKLTNIKLTYPFNPNKISAFSQIQWKLSVIQNMTSVWLAAELRNKITDKHTHDMMYYEPEFFLPENHGTAHVSVVAEDGSAVAATSTINLYLGSKVLSNSTGILLNNEMDDFSSPFITNGFGVPPSPNNFIRPGKRPMSSMCPTILFDKDHKVKMVAGGSGGTKITTSIAQVILNALFFGFDLKKSVEDPRLHNQLSPNVTVAEPGFDQKILDGLILKNHLIEQLKSTGAVVQAIVQYKEGLRAQSDPRKFAHAAGY
ncbi:hypothetical protein WMY93_006528 [Mugilogobius chulae]|uniref:Gamma-glutamyltransferase 1 n=1 Tax=Mugilogobius chulae TaxID=88201 RepID=A0AAW0PRH2_9GOBI